VQADRKRESSALPNELRNSLSRLMTLMHSWLIRVTLVAGKVFAQNCDTGNPSAMYNVETLYCKYKGTVAKRRSIYIYIYIYIYTTLTFLTLLGALYIYDISRLRVKLQELENWAVQISLCRNFHFFKLLYIFVSVTNTLLKLPTMQVVY
jgi:hypothetical protein